MLGVIAIRMAGTKLEWDAEKMQIHQLPGGQPFVNPPYRTGWKL